MLRYMFQLLVSYLLARVSLPLKLCLLAVCWLASLQEQASRALKKFSFVHKTDVSWCYSNCIQRFTWSFHYLDRYDLHYYYFHCYSFLYFLMGIASWAAPLLDLFAIVAFCENQWERSDSDSRRKSLWMRLFSSGIFRKKKKKKNILTSSSLLYPCQNIPQIKTSIPQIKTSTLAEQKLEC